MEGSARHCDAWLTAPRHHGLRCGRVVVTARGDARSQIRRKAGAASTHGATARIVDGADPTDLCGGTVAHRTGKEIGRCWWFRAPPLPTTATFHPAEDRTPRDNPPRPRRQQKRASEEDDDDDVAPHARSTRSTGSRRHYCVHIYQLVY